MQRASISIVTRAGTRYDANHISIYREQVSPQECPPYGGARSVLAFQCSGGLTVKPAEDIERIEFYPASAQYCSECDQSIFNYVGAGIHESPGYREWQEAEQAKQRAAMEQAPE